VELLARLARELVDGDDGQVAALVRDAIQQELPAERILNEGLIAGMNVVGQRFKVHEIYLPDVLLAAQAMNAGMEQLRPLLIRDNIPTRGKVVLGSVRGDLHDIGKNLVGVLLKGAGFEVLDLGHDVPPARFVDTAQARKAAVIGMSALLTTTMPAMSAVVQLARERGLSGQVKTIIGGAPVTEKYAREIGADAYAYDAANAVERVTSLIGGD